MESRFLNLPPEIRHRICEEIFRDTVVLVRCELPRECPPLLQKSVSRRYYRTSNQVDMNITLVSKQVRSEAYCTFLATALFDVRFFHTNCKRISVHSELVQDELRQHYVDCLSKIRRARLQEVPILRSNLLHMPYKVMTNFLEESSKPDSIMEMIIRTRQARIQEDPEAGFTMMPVLQQAATDSMRQFITDHQHLNIVLEQEIVLLSPGLGPKPVWLAEVRVKDGEGRILVWPEPKKAQDFLLQYLEAIGLRPNSTAAIAIMA